ncbi:MAG: hypothetical protein SVU32_08020, partial [Candidatus Nanohaloarchaea archaeon]|nr:hypothetical protein [Candidatus Nanohaloarchaea archaeon]
MNRFYRVLLVAGFVVAVASTGLAAQIQVEGLKFQKVNASFGSNQINFSVYNDTVSLTPKQVFVPDEIAQHATVSGFEVQNGAAGKRIAWSGYQYDTGWSHPSKAVMDLLAWGSGGGADAGSPYPATYFQIGAYTSNVTGENQSVSDVFDYEFVD